MDPAILYERPSTFIERMDALLKFNNANMTNAVLEDAAKSPLVEVLVWMFPQGKETFVTAQARVLTGASANMEESLQFLLSFPLTLEKSEAVMKALQYFKDKRAAGVELTQNGNPPAAIGPVLQQAQAPKPPEIGFFQRYEFQLLPEHLVAKLRRIGLSDSQVMGAEHHVRKSSADPMVQMSAISMLITGTKEDIMQERSYFQSLYRTTGPLPLTQVGKFALTDENAARNLQREQALEKEKQALLQAELAQRRADEITAQKQERNKVRSRVLDLPEDFTLDDL